MPTEPTATTTGAATGDAAGTEAMNRLLRRGSQPSRPFAFGVREAPGQGEAETPAAPETIAGRMRVRAEEIDAQLGQGGFRDATERAFLTGYGRALLDWAEAAEAETAGP